MKKTLSFAAVSALAISAVAVTAPAPVDAAVTTAQPGFYDTTTNTYYTVAQFQSLTQEQKKALVKDGVYLYTGASVISAKDAVLSTNAELPSKYITPANFTAANLDAIYAASQTPVQTGELKVESVSAINGKEIKVTFSKTLSTSAAIAGNFAVKVNGSPVTPTAELQDDKKSIILRLGTAIAKGTTYEVDAVKDIVAEDLTILKATNNISYDGLPTLFSDSTAPSVLSVEPLSNTQVRVFFSEPVTNTYTLKLDGGSASSGVATTNTKGKYYADVTVPAGATTVGNHTVVLYDVTDDNSNKASILNKTYTVSNDTTAPSVQSITAESATTFKVKFSEKLASTPVVGDIEIKKGTATLTTFGVTADLTDTTGTTYIVTVADATINPVYAEGENSVNLTVKVKNFKDLANLVGTEYNGSVTLSKDATKPTVLSEALNYSDVTGGSDKLVIRFNEDIDNDTTAGNALAAVATTNFSLSYDGIERPAAVTAAAIQNDENGKPRLLVLTIDRTKISSTATSLPTGDYAVTIAANAVYDASKNGVAKTTTKVKHAGTTTTHGINPSVVTITENVIEVTYGTNMGDSAIDASNYTFDGVALPANTEVKFYGTKQVVRIVLPAETYAKAETKKLIISKDVKTSTGLSVIDSTVSPAQVAVEQNLGVKDNVAPVFEKAEFVKQSESNNNTQVVKLTFSEGVVASDVQDFLFKVGNTKVSVASLSTTSNDKEVVLVLSEPVNVTQTSTVEITTNTTHNTNGVINVVDKSTLTSPNKVAAKSVSVGTIVDATVFNAANTLTGIAITTPSTKLTYSLGEVFASTGLVVTGTKADSSTVNVTSSATFTGFNSTTAGTKTVTVNVGTLSTTYDVTVNKGVATGNPTLGTVPNTGTLNDVTLGGSLSYNGTTVAGTFAWDAPTTALAGSGLSITGAWTFTPTDATNYEVVTGTATVTTP